MKKVYIYTFAGNFGHTMMNIVEYKADGTLDWGNIKTKGTSRYKEVVQDYKNNGFEVEFKDNKEKNRVNKGLVSYSTKMNSI